MTHFGRLLGGFIILAFMLGLFCVSAETAEAAGAWKWKGEAEAGLAYDTNVYSLSSTQKARLKEDRASDQTSGRFNDMESVEDLILTPRFKAAGKTIGLGGRGFEVKPSILYELYAENTKKNHFELGLGLKHELWAEDWLAIEFGYAPDVYKKNYLSDAVDVTNDGVSSSERVYSPATYNDVKVDLVYGRRLWKRGKGPRASGGVERVDGEVLAGIQKSEYDSPFGNRSEDSIR